MRSSNLSQSLSRLVVSSLVVSLLFFQTIIAKASAVARTAAAAEITVFGPSDNGERPFVEVNGEQAFSGRTFFSNGTINTTDTNSATISLGRIGRLELAPSSSLVLSFDNGRIGGTLSKGSLTISNTDGVDVEINTPTDTVTNESGAASRFTVVATGSKAGVAVASGAVRANGARVAVKDDDDDDDDDDYWKIWATVGVVVGAVVLVVLLNNNDDDDVVSPVR
jgi:hypothetical protein